MGQRIGQLDWRIVPQRVEPAHFGWICAHLGHRRPPDDHGDCSILICCLSKDELRRALHGPPAEAYPPAGAARDPAPR